MANKPSFITKFLTSRFFTHTFRFSRKKTAKKSVQDVQERPAKAPVHSKPLKLSEHQRPAGTSQTEDPYTVTLPIDHPLHQLWRKRRDEQGWLPMPQLSFQNEGGPAIFTSEQAAGENAKFQLSLTALANSRLSAATPKQEDVPVNLDAQAVTYLAKDLLSAWVLVFPPVGEGKELSAKTLSSALETSKVSFGVDKKFLDELPQREDRYFKLFLAARGQAAVAGVNGGITDHFPREVDRTLPVDEYNRVDYTAVSSHQNIEKDAVICDIAPPSPGVPGKNVLGKVIPTMDGKPAPVPMGRNTAINEEGTALIATKTGNLEFSGKVFQVHPELIINGNVDYSSGRIRCLGDVHITGDVCSGFSVRAMGNIKVDGVVESSNIEAGGDLVLAKGVQGNNQAIIRAHKDIFAKYLENCTVYARENLHSECIIGCNVYSDAAVFVQTGRGTIIGGNIWAAREVSANTLGSKTEVRTTITLGGLPWEDYEKDIISKEIERLEQELAETERQPHSTVKVTRMSKLRMQLSVNKMKLSQYMKSLEDAEKAAAQQPGARAAFDVAHRGTRIKIGEALLRIREETRHSIALLIDGQVRLMT